MFDATFYTQHILRSANYILSNNLQQVGQPFANEFMFVHDIGGQYQNALANAQNLFNFVAEGAKGINPGRPMQLSDQQLGNIVGAYINGKFMDWQRANQRPQMGGFGSQPLGNMGMGGFGGFGQPQQPMGMANQPARASMSVGFGDVITPQGQNQQPQNQITNPQAATPITISDTSVEYSHNPLDALTQSEINLNLVSEASNWGVFAPQDRSIAIMKRASIKSRDERFVIKQLDGFLRTYNDNPLSVVQHFFKIVPDQFLAESFIFRLFYNNIEIVPISTEDFVKVRDAFVEAIAKDRSPNVYQIIIRILNDLLHGPRMVMATYLVKHINRALTLSCGMKAHPHIRIKFTQIEDLEELLGTNFNSKLFEVPHSRETIQTIVATAITNALTGYTDVLFSDSATCDPAIIKTSAVFPFNLFHVYPNKAIIPDKDDTTFDEFYASLQKHQLSNRTFVRSIRSVIITNILGKQALQAAGNTPSKIPGDVSSILSGFALDHTRLEPVMHNHCDMYSDYSFTGSNDTEEYRAYIAKPTEYERAEFEAMSDGELPFLPVDQVLYAVQFKKSPKDYIEAFDLYTTMDANPSTDEVILAKAPRALTLF